MKNHVVNKINIKDKLWAAAEQLRANSSLKLNEIAEPVLGLIFLKFADVKFRKMTETIQDERKEGVQSGSSSRVRPITSDDYKSRGVVYVPEQASYEYLLSLPEDSNILLAIMYPRQHKNTVNNTYPRFNITDYVREFLLNIREKEGRIFRTNHYNEVMYMKELLNTPRYTSFKSIRDFNTGIHHWNEQRVDFVGSNLGNNRGFIFYFICNGCRRRVKHLYEYTMLNSPLCRICCRLGYETTSRKTRSLSRLLRKSNGFS